MKDKRSTCTIDEFIELIQSTYEKAPPHFDKSFATYLCQYIEQDMKHSDVYIDFRCSNCMMSYKASLLVGTHESMGGMGQRLAGEDLHDAVDRFFEMTDPTVERLPEIREEWHA